MKGVRVALIVILCGFIAFLCGVLGFFLIRRGNMGFSIIGNNQTVFSQYQQVQEKEIDATSIENITVDYGMNNSDVYFYQSTGDKIVVKEYFNFDPEEGLLSTIEAAGDKLTIRGKRRNNNLFGVGTNSYTEIYLPKAVLSSLAVTTISGDINSDLSFDLSGNAQFTSTSGDIGFAYMKCDQLIISTVSGEMNFREVDADVSASATSGDVSISGKNGDRQICTVSGEVNLYGMEGNFDISTTSGDVTLSDAKGCGRVGTVSGSANVALASMTGSLNFSTTSGDVSLRLPDTESFKFEFNSTSGDVNTYFDDVLSFNKRRTSASGTYGTDSNKQIYVSTVSGDLQVGKY